MIRMIPRRVALCLVLAAATLFAAAGDGMAASRAKARVRGASAFDGVWSVLIITRAGQCDRGYRYSVTISGGVIASNYGVAGRVLPNGVVRVAVSQGGGQAYGTGRLRGNVGSGAWRGFAAGASCSGVWSAHRRG